MRTTKWIWLAIFLPAAAIVLTPTSSGHWQCGLCGKHERRFDVLFVPLQREAIPNPYHDWFQKNDGRPQDHDWMGMGCHQRGNLVYRMISCSFRTMSLQDQIPGLSNPKKAVDTLFSLSTDERYQEFADFGRIDQSPASVAYGEWWARHPPWQEVFPPPLKK